MTLLILFVSVAAVLTFTLFQTKQTILGWAAYTFWAFSGFQSYSLRTGQDIYFWFAFFCLIGGLVFTALAALGFRSPGDADAEELMDDRTLRDDEREDRRIERSEAATERAEMGDGMSDMDRPRESAATQRVRQRASNRRNNGRSKIRW